MKQFLYSILFLLPFSVFGQVLAPTNATTKLAGGVSTSFNSFYFTSGGQYGWLNGSTGLWEQNVTGRQITSFYYPRTHIDSVVAGLISIKSNINISYPVSNGGSAKTGNLQMGKIKGLVLDSASATLESRPGIVRLNNSTLIAFYMKVTGTVYYKISTDFGKIWGVETFAFTDSSLYGEINATLLPNGKLFITVYKVTAIGYVLATVNSNALSFSAVIYLPPFCTNENVTSAPIIVLANGDYLWPVWGSNTSDPYNRAGVLRSTDGGATWGSYINIASTIGEGTGFTEAQSVQMANGDIVMIIRSAVSAINESYGKYYRSVSTDNGVTWSAPTVSLDITRVGRPSVAITSAGGLFLLCRGNALGLNARAVYQTSWDEGVTWSSPLPLDYTPEVDLYKLDNYDAVVSQSGGSISAITNIQTAHISAGTYKYQLKYFEFYDGDGLMPGGNIIVKTLIADTVTNVKTPGYLVDIQDSVASSSNTIAQIWNKDTTTNNATYFRARQESFTNNSYSSFFGQRQDKKLVIIANDPSRGGDLIIDDITGAAQFSGSLTSATPPGTAGTDSLVVKIGSSKKYGAISASYYAPVNTPTFVTPHLGTPIDGVITNLTGTCTSCNISGNAATVTNGVYTNTSNILTGLLTRSSTGVGQAMKFVTSGTAGFNAITFEDSNPSITNFGSIGVTSTADKWFLGHQASPGALSTPDLTWDKFGNVGVAGNLSATLPAYSSGTYLPAIYNSTNNRFETLASYPSNKANGYIPSLTAAQTLTSYNVGASDAPFLVSANILVTASSVNNFTVTCSYYDESNTIRVVTLTFSQVAGTLVTAITNVTGTGVYEGIPIHIRAKAGTTIFISTAGTFTSITYNGGGLITQEAAN